MMPSNPPSARMTEQAQAELCQCSWADDLAPERPCGCGEHTARLYRDTVWHWGGKHWVSGCLIAVLTRQPTEQARHAEPDDLGPHPKCPRCEGTGEEPNAQFRCPCRWSNSLLREKGELLAAIDEQAQHEATARALADKIDSYVTAGLLTVNGLADWILSALTAATAQQAEELERHLTRANKEIGRRERAEVAHSLSEAKRLALIDRAEAAEAQLAQQAEEVEKWRGWYTNAQGQIDDALKLCDEAGIDTETGIIDVTRGLLAQLAQQADEIARLRKALRYAREPLAIAATYDADGESVGIRLHARDCAEAVTAIDSALSEGTRT